MPERPRMVLSFIGSGSLQKATYRYQGGVQEATYFAKVLQQAHPHHVLIVFLGVKAFAAHQQGIRDGLSVEPLKVPTDHHTDALWEAFDVVTDAVPEGAQVLVDITAADRTQAVLALTACNYLRAARGIQVEGIVSGAPYVDAGGAHPTQDLSPLIDFIDWSGATEQFLRYGNALPLRDRLLDATFSNAVERGAVTGLARQLENLTESLALLRPVETLDSAVGIRQAIKRLQDVVHDVPEARPIEPLLSRIQARFDPFSEAGKLTEPAGFRALAHMITVYLQTEHYVEAITLAREALVTRVCADEGWHALHERRRAEDFLGGLGHRFKERLPLAENEVGWGKLWSRLSDLRNDISHAGFRLYPTNADSAIRNVREYCDEAIAVLLG